jgi:hypothetical protein
MPRRPFAHTSIGGSCTGLIVSGAELCRTLLQTHHEAITAFDFFTVPTVDTLTGLCFFVIRQDGGSGFSTESNLVYGFAEGIGQAFLYH